MARLQLEIVTPLERIFSGEVDEVVVPGAGGELGILPEHSPLLTQVIPGELRYRKGSQESRLAIGEGFAEVTPTHVSILTDLAVSEEAIDEKELEEAIRRAEAAVKEKQLGGEELALVQSSLQKSLAQLRVKRRRHY